MSGTRSLKWADRDRGVLTPNGCRSMALVLLGLLSAAAVVIAVRGFAGALETPLEPATLLTAAALVAAAAVVVRLGWLLPFRSSRAAKRDSPIFAETRIATVPGRLDQAVMVITTFAAAALCGGLCLPPDTSPAAVLLFRVVILAEEGWAWLWFFRKRGQNYFTSAKKPSDMLTRERNSSDPFLTPAAEEMIPAAEVIQQLTRSQAADGAEELSGWLRAPFATGQRTGSVHVAFCPPLCVTPELTVEQIEGPDVRIKTAQVLPYGARFDLKLAAAADGPTTVLLQFSARASGEK